MDSMGMVEAKKKSSPWEFREKEINFHVGRVKRIICEVWLQFAVVALNISLLQMVDLRDG